MKKHGKTPISKKLMFILLASGGFALAQISHAADAGAGAGAQVGAGAEVGAGGSGPSMKMDGAAGVDVKADGSVKEPMPMMQDSTRGLDQAKEQMNEQAIQHEQATEATGKVETKKSAKTKRDKKPAPPMQ